ncbi:2-oxoglutarate (2OG) and Fe(II)-dependent oxygenase superfamily protein [Rhynchospora pubera]|uniref:procollagen-proline 3-dioxygenase n=1 Tax=Rhynchospora pubera TaxID=906938 RepID=A0AAV8FRQ2_9POAL|nr:2-oxoglutarate (2OG) and Fe(II)-dependent oxygenase superfamily protein [Rhynchospora pubera]
MESSGVFPETAAHPRRHLRGFLSLDLCKELEFIHRSCATAGYRTGVLSTTLAHLSATGCSHLLLPFVKVREQLKEAVEEAFDCQFELFVEFTGLISWCKGASIGWHSDDNKPYLKQRDFSAVCYLNDQGKDFKGGTLRFQDGEPSSIAPVAGDVAIYTADYRNVHCVDEIIEGERLTLTLWFTRDSASDEDPKLLNFLSQALERNREGPFYPLPASDNMYLFTYNGSSFDLRCARACQLGYTFYSSACSEKIPEDSFEMLSKPLFIGREDEVFEKEFVSSMHALQVMQFYHWKASKAAKVRGTKGQAEQEFISRKHSYTQLVLSCDKELAESVLQCNCHVEMENLFSWDDFALAIENWERYTTELRRKLSAFMPSWLSYQSIYYIDDPSELNECEK